MPTPVFTSDQPVILLGASKYRSQTLSAALTFSSDVVAADGGANQAIKAGLPLRAIVGDLDSITPDVAGQIPAGLLHPVDEQETTDFEKSWTRIDAPLTLAVGFSGGRTDHTLAVLSCVARRHRRRCIVVGDEDIVFHAPRTLNLDLPARTRVSLFPMSSVGGTSTGLRWPIDGLSFSQLGQIGVSNEADGTPLSLSLDGPGMLVILPLEFLGDAVRALAG